MHEICDCLIFVNLPFIYHKSYALFREFQCLGSYLLAKSPFFSIKTCICADVIHKYTTL
jgi:hypothetical protein